MIINNPDKVRVQHFTKNTKVKHPYIDFLIEKKNTKVQNKHEMLVDSTNLTLKHPSYRILEQ